MRLYLWYKHYGIVFCVVIGGVEHFLWKETRFSQWESHSESHDVSNKHDFSFQHLLFFSPPLLLLYQPTSSLPTPCRASHLHCFFFKKRSFFHKALGTKTAHRCMRNPLKWTHLDRWRLKWWEKHLIHLWWRCILHSPAKKWSRTWGWEKSGFMETAEVLSYEAGLFNVHLLSSEAMLFWEGNCNVV